MELIQTVTVGSGGASSITFSSIPATYDDLQVVFSLRNSGTANVVTRLQFNADTASNYSSRLLYGTGSSAAAFAETRDSFYIGNHPASSNTANTFGSQAIYIPNYRSGVAKSVSADTVEENNSTAGWQQISAHLWTGTAAITSMRIYPDSGNWVEGSSASLYGIRRFNTSAQPKATGGAISFDAVNNKWVHVFSTSGTFTPTANITCEYLVVAGGGGGAGLYGGGGAGGYRSSVAGESSGGGGSAESALSLTSGTNYTVTIGAGGTGGNSKTAVAGTRGSDSVFGSITASGGGAGISNLNIESANGGSGGGGRGNTGTGIGGTGTANQGFAGGTGTNNGAFFGGGGGGGAGAVGGNPNLTTRVSGNGGNGVSSSITGTSVAYAGGGGGGGAFDSGSAGTGGTGGTGGGGSSTAHPVAAAQANRGGGGGACNSIVTSAGDSTLIGGNGGSGIVIVRYNA